MVLCILFYANLDFQFLIKSNSSSFFWPGSTFTWNYSICLCIKTQIIYGSDFTNKKIKSFMHFKITKRQYITEPYLNSARVEVDLLSTLVVCLTQTVLPRLINISSTFIQIYICVFWHFRGGSFSYFIPPPFFSFSSLNISSLTRNSQLCYHI